MLVAVSNPVFGPLHVSHEVGPDVCIHGLGASGNGSRDIRNGEDRSFEAISSALTYGKEL